MNATQCPHLSGQSVVNFRREKENKTRVYFIQQMYPKKCEWSDFWNEIYCLFDNRSPPRYVHLSIVFQHKNTNGKQLWAINWFEVDPLCPWHQPPWLLSQNASQSIAATSSPLRHRNTCILLAAQSASSLISCSLKPGVFKNCKCFFRMLLCHGLQQIIGTMNRNKRV